MRGQRQSLQATPLWYGSQCLKRLRAPAGTDQYQQDDSSWPGRAAMVYTMNAKDAEQLPGGVAPTRL